MQHSAQTVAVDTEERRTGASQCVVDGSGRVGDARRRAVCGVWCVVGAWRSCARCACVFGWCAAKSVKKLALVGLDPTTFGL